MQKVALLIGLFSLILTGVAFSQENTTDSLTIGSIHTLQSEVLNESRSISVYLPDGYDKSDEHYPVVYLLDGMKSRMMYAASTMEMLDGGGLIPKTIKNSMVACI